MSPEILIAKFGYLAVFIGTFLEGEAILVMAGLLAERGYFPITNVMVVGFLGAFSGHLFWFWLGRVYGVKLLDRFPRLKEHFGKGVRLFERYGAAAIIITQWLYGLRITCAVIIGISRISVLKFLVYQTLSCAVWTVTIATAGYYFGRAVESVLGKAAHYEKWAILGIVVVAVGIWLWRHLKGRREPADS
jgi:membrane protein DedA with SNARE-associated domain